MTSSFTAQPGFATIYAVSHHLPEHIPLVIVPAMQPRLRRNQGNQADAIIYQHPRRKIVLNDCGHSWRS